MASVAGLHFCIYADIVGGWEKVQNYADLFYGWSQAEIHALFGNITTKAFAQFILVTSRATAHITKSLKAQEVFNDLPYSLLLASYVYYLG